MAGLWPLSGQQRHDLNGKPYPGALAYFYDASTDDPIEVYREYSLATLHPNPVQADGFGVWPNVFVPGANTFYRYRLTTAAGVVLSDTVAIPNVEPAGGGGGDPVEPVAASAVAKTGDIKARFGSGIHDGWLLCNGLTMGSSTSGASYATDDNEALFVHLWQNDASLSVVGGRGASAAADWSANKRITLPDMRGRSPVGLDTMGNSAAGVFAALDVLGEKLGGSLTLTAAQIPQITGTTNTTGAHTHTIPHQIWTGTKLDGSGGATIYPVLPVVTATTSGGDHSHTVTAGSVSPTAVSTTAPSMGLSFYIKK